MFATLFFKFQLVIVILKDQLMCYAMIMEYVIVKLKLVVTNVLNVLPDTSTIQHVKKVKANSILNCIF